MATITVPSGFRRVIDRDTRKVRIVSSDLAPMSVIAQQRTGEFTGQTARVVCEPAFLAWDLIKGLGRAVAGSNVGVGYSYGWDQMDRKIAIIKAKRSIAGATRNNPHDVEAMRSHLVETGALDPQNAKNADVDTLARAMAETQINDPWVDADSFVLIASSESVKQQNQQAQHSTPQAEGYLNPA